MNPIFSLASIITCFGFSVVFTPLFSQEGEQPPAPDLDLPQAFDSSTLDALIQNPPFTRSVNPSDSLILTGLAYIDGKPVVTLLDTSTKQSIAVSEKPNAKGWILKGAPIMTDVTRAVAQVSIGGEVVSLRYNKAELESDKNKGAPQTNSSGGGQGEKYDRGRSGGPSREDMEKYNSLSDSAKQKLRDAFSANREKLMQATPEERSAFMRATFERVQRDDQGGGR